MADAKPPTPGGTAPIPDSPELVNLKEREKSFVDELARLEKMDANKASKDGFDINAVKNRTKLHLAEIRKAIQEAKK